MQAIFHGVRGSVPVSGQEFASFGGHTTCLEIRTKDVQIIIDTGSGFQNVGIAEDGLVIIAFSHFHHDHIQGIAFNRDLLTGKRDILVTSGLCNPSALQQNIQTYFDGAFCIAAEKRHEALGTVFHHTPPCGLVSIQASISATRQATTRSLTWMRLGKFGWLASAYRCLRLMPSIAAASLGLTNVWLDNARAL